MATYRCTASPIVSSRPTQSFSTNPGSLVPMITFIRNRRWSKRVCGRNSLNRSRVDVVRTLTGNRSRNAPTHRGSHADLGDEVDGLRRLVFLERDTPRGQVANDGPQVVDLEVRQPGGTSGANLNLPGVVQAVSGGKKWQP